VSVFIPMLCAVLVGELFAREACRRYDDVAMMVLVWIYQPLYISSSLINRMMLVASSGDYKFAFKLHQNQHGDCALHAKYTYHPLLSHQGDTTPITSTRM